MDLTPRNVRTIRKPTSNKLFLQGRSTVVLVFIDDKQNKQKKMPRCYAKRLGQLPENLGASNLRLLYIGVFYSHRSSSSIYLNGPT